MKRIFGGLWICSLLMALSACNDVEINDGNIPQAYLNEAAALTGVYGGTMENSEPLSIEFKLENNQMEGRLIDNPFGTACDAQLGKLKRVRVEELENGWVIERAVFDFHPNKCAPQIMGRELELVRSGQGYSIEVLADTKRNFICETADSFGLRGDLVGRTCHWETDRSYLRGGITKLNI